MTAEPLRLAAAAMGTRFELLVHEGRGNLRAAGEAALDEIARWHQLLNRFAPDSLLSHINRTAATRPVRLDGETFALLQTAMDAWRASDGAFDITVAPLMVRNGFADSSVSARGARPGAPAIELNQDDCSVRFANTGIALDLGAIGKGHALDCAAAILRDAGVTSAFLHGGTSSITAIGRPPTAGGWRVAIGSTPDSEIVELHDEAISVSAPGGQISPAGATHIVDPLTGLSIATDGPIAVRGPSCSVTDAWSTALVVLSERAARRWTCLDEYLPAGYRSIPRERLRRHQVPA